ncbi:MAG: hypothetical protein P8Z79_12725, partial [Sedimentisphaerales bacterium]
LAKGASLARLDRPGVYQNLLFSAQFVQVAARDKAAEVSDQVLTVSPRLTLSAYSGLDSGRIRRDDSMPRYLTRQWGRSRKGYC